MAVKLREQKNKKGEIRFHLDIHDRGIRHREFISEVVIYPSDSTNDKREKKSFVTQVKAKREIEIASEGLNIVAEHKKKMDFFDYFQQFIDKTNNANVRMYSATFGKFKEFYKLEYGKSSLPMKNLNATICEKFKNYLESDKSKLSGDTPSDYWAKFKRILNSAVREKLINGNPADGIVFKKKPRRIKKSILSIEELRMLNETHCGNEYVKDTFFFCCFTGLGRAEIEKLTWSKIDLSNNKMIVVREKSDTPMTNNLHPTTIAILNKYRRPDSKPSDKVFPELPSVTAVSKSLDKWMKGANIEKHITFYCARHSFAVMLLNKTGNLYIVKRAMGHLKLETTLKYLEYADGAESEAITELPALAIAV